MFWFMIPALHPDLLGSSQYFLGSTERSTSTYRICGPCELALYKCTYRLSDYALHKSTIDTDTDTAEEDMLVETCNSIYLTKSTLYC